MSRDDAPMDFEDAANEIEDADNMIKIAYKTLMSVEKNLPISGSYPLKDVIINLGMAQLGLSIVKNEYRDKI